MVTISICELRLAPKMFCIHLVLKQLERGSLLNVQQLQILSLYDENGSPSLKVLLPTALHVVHNAHLVQMFILPTSPHTEQVHNAVIHFCNYECFQSLGGDVLNFQGGSGVCMSLCSLLILLISATCIENQITSLQVPIQLGHIMNSNS